MSTKSSDNRVGTSFETQRSFFLVQHRRGNIAFSRVKTLILKRFRNTMGLSESVKNNYFTQLIMYRARIHYYQRTVVTLDMLQMCWPDIWHEQGFVITHEMPIIFHLTKKTFNKVNLSSLKEVLKGDL